MMSRKSEKRWELIRHGSPLSQKNFEMYKLLKYQEKDLYAKDQLYDYEMNQFYTMPVSYEIYTEKECVEFYTRERVVLMYQGIIIDEFKNPFTELFGEDIWHPYCRVVNKFNPGTEISQSLPEQLIDMQFLRDLIDNAFADQLKMSLNPMYIASDNLFFDESDDGKMKYEAHKIIRAAGNGKLDKFAITDVDSNIFTITDYVDNRGYSTAGINRTTAAVGGATPRSAKDAAYQYEITFDNLRTYAANNAQALNKLSRIWIIEGYHKLPDNVEGRYKKFLFTIKKSLKDRNLDYEIEFTNETLDAYFVSQNRESIGAVADFAVKNQMNAVDGLPNVDLR